MNPLRRDEGRKTQRKNYLQRPLDPDEVLQTNLKEHVDKWTETSFYEEKNVGRKIAEGWAKEDMKKKGAFVSGEKDAFENVFGAMGGPLPEEGKRGIVGPGKLKKPQADVDKDIKKRGSDELKAE